MKVWFCLFIPLFLQATHGKIIEEPWRANPCAGCQSAKSRDDRLITNVQIGITVLPCLAAATSLLIVKNPIKRVILGAVLAYGTYKAAAPLAISIIDNCTIMQRNYTCPYTHNCMYYRP